jgi:hypothetical protein
VACHLQIDADPVPVPDPAYHFDADPESDFYLMRMPKRMPKEDSVFLLKNKAGSNPQLF